MSTQFYNYLFTHIRISSVDIRIQFMYSYMHFVPFNFIMNQNLCISGIASTRRLCVSMCAFLSLDFEKRTYDTYSRALEPFWLP